MLKSTKHKKKTFSKDIKEIIVKTKCTLVTYQYLKSVNKKLIWLLRQ